MGALETFSGLMGMLPPISQPAYSSYNKKLLVVSQKEREASCSAAIAELCKDVPEDDIVDITISCDGTWARRGFQSLYGVIVVAS